jgi:cellulose synthase/poly-beta-1,6-N-acetylglucosamine synthase-like glycosyltransferase
MSPLEYVFWACLALIAHTYLAYPVLLFAVYCAAQVRRDWAYLTGDRERRQEVLPPAEQPAVSIIIPAYNEARRLPDKLANLRQIEYPPDKLELIFVSDGSTDGTNDLLKSLREPHARIVVLPVRQGKPTALNHGVRAARHDLLVLCDAATLFTPGAIGRLVRHFRDPRVGVVCGMLQFSGSGEFPHTEGVYWKYERMLRIMEGRLGATLTASGAIYALRRECYRPLTADVLIDDFVIPMQARKQGYRVVLDPEAVATEFAAESVRDEFSRRVRLAAGSFRALGEFLRTPLPPFTFVAFVSHKVLRWVLPFLMIGLLLSNAWLLDDALYRAVFIGQLVFYLWAGLGFLFRDRMRRVRFGLIGYFLVSIHLAFLVGFARFLTGREKATWQRVT